MIRHVRWKSWLTWLAGVVVVLLAIQYCLCLWVRSSIARHGAAVLGTKVELAHARVSLFERRVDLQKLRVADPRDPSENLLEMDHCSLDVGVAALLQRPVIVGHARADGLRIGVPREATAPRGDRLHVAEVSTLDWEDGFAADATCRWLEHVEQQFEHDFLNLLPSVRLSEELSRRWPARLAALEQRAEDLHRRGEELHERFRTARANPLRHRETLEKLPDEIAQLQDEFARLSAEVDRMPDRLDADRRAIAAAGGQDEAWLRDALRVDSIDASAMSAYLLREQIDGPIGQIIAWLHRLRGVAPTADSPTDRSPPPLGLIVRTLDMQGRAHVGDQRFAFRGKLHNYSTSPARQEHPMRLSLASKGRLPLELTATLDRTGSVPRDELQLEVHGLPLPAARLGSRDTLHLAIAPSTASLDVRLRIEADRLVGDVQLLQRQVKVAPGVGDALRRLRVDRTLDNVLGKVDSIAVQISIRGPVDEPRISLTSDLGPAVAEALDPALRRAADRHADAMLAHSRRHVEERLADLERRIVLQTSELLDPLVQLHDGLEQMADKQRPADRLSVEQLGRLPAQSLFR